MKLFKTIIIGVAFIFGALLIACGSDSGSDVDTDEVAEVKTVYSLGACKAENEGATKLVTSENRYYKCVDGDWEKTDSLQHTVIYEGSSSSAVENLEYSSSCCGDFAEFAKGVKGTMTDERDGHVYKTVKIGNQEWMAENLNYRYLGPTLTADSSSFCFDGNPANCDIFGRLYLWSAAMDSAGMIAGNIPNYCGYSHGLECSVIGPVRGVCPLGWHLPSKWEWEELIVAVGCSVDIGNEQHCKDSLMSEFSVGHAIDTDSTAGTKLKSTSGWYPPGNGTDDFGFSVLPAGRRGHDDVDVAYGYRSIYAGNSVGNAAFFWSSSGRYDWVGYIKLHLSEDYVTIFEGGSIDKTLGFSVRCIKD